MVEMGKEHIRIGEDVKRNTFFGWNLERNAILIIEERKKHLPIGGEGRFDKGGEKHIPFVKMRLLW